jgi:PIN domain nuclease of toxin-antitoxin system
MFYLIETKDQLNKLKEKIPFNQYIYLEYIQGNDNTHPALAEVIAVYLNVEDKGYIIPINHPECINWDKDAVFSVLSNYEFKVYDKKAALHLNPQISYTDIQHQTPLQTQHTTQAHAWYYRKFPHTKVNKMIPIGKHLERCNSKYNEIIGFPHVINTYFDNKLLPALYRLEKNALKFNGKFDDYFTTKCKKFSIKENYIYGWYNPYTTTGRPVNNFNGINFVGLKHDNGERDCFEPDNDFFVEMDYDGYHPRLIGDIVGYRFHGNVHNELAQIYFKSKEITPQQYKESKTLTFKQIYGGIDKANLHHPFFRKTQDFINIIWEEFNNKGEIICGGYEIKKENHPKIHAQKLFNYYIQATETYTNVEKINEIQDYLEDKQTKLVLYIYDAFIFDVSKLDGKQTLIDLQNILSSKFPIKLKVGKHYGALS